MRRISAPFLAACVAFSACVTEPELVPGGIGWQAVDVGGAHACAVSFEGRLACWGANDRGQAGTGGGDWLGVAAWVRGDRPFRAVSSGGRHTCALDTDGGLWCWGGNGAGQVGDGSVDDRPEPVRILPEAAFIDVSAGWEHTCAVTSRGLLLCWGENSFGQAGIGESTGTSLPPTPVAGERRWAGVAAGAAHTCALDVVGAAFCWGDHRSGALGTGVLLPSPGPSRVAPTSTFQFLTAGPGTSCALEAEARAWCWGDNRAAQIDGSGSALHGSPVPMGGHGVAGVGVGEQVVCALGGDGSVRCRGARWDPDGTATVPPQGFAPLGPSRSTWVDLSVGWRDGCAIDASGILECWGQRSAPAAPRSAPLPLR